MLQRPSEGVTEGGGKGGKGGEEIMKNDSSLIVCPHCGKSFRLGEVNEEQILSILRQGPKSYSELTSANFNFSKVTLVKRLKSLIQQQKIERKVIPSFPPRTQYSLKPGETGKENFVKKVLEGNME